MPKYDESMIMYLCLIKLVTCEDVSHGPKCEFELAPSKLT